MSTSEEVTKLQAELEEMQPLLEQAQVNGGMIISPPTFPPGHFYACSPPPYLQVETDQTMEQIEKDTKVAEETKVVVTKEEKEAKIKADETQTIADDAQKDLDEALPALVRSLYLS